MQSICFVYEIGRWVLKWAPTIYMDAQKAKARILIPMYQFLMHCMENWTTGYELKKNFLN